ncbi:MAG: hypothetical protein KC776_23565 [Myxococcales bacterium]|nr:hypothetical protein [Myxococcales bacterium]
MTRPAWQPRDLPFAHLNLRHNPFGELPTDERARVAEVGELSCPRGSVVQLLGDAGRGKSTHLWAWHARNPGSLYEYVPEGACTLRARALPELCFVDEAQRLSRVELRRLFSDAARLVLASHADLSGFTRRPVRTRMLTGMSEERLGRILTRRVEAARRSTGPVPRFPAETLRAIVARFGDDLRSAESHLYDVFQRLEGPGDVRL